MFQSDVSLLPICPKSTPIVGQEALEPARIVFRSRNLPTHLGTSKAPLPSVAVPNEKVPSVSWPSQPSGRRRVTLVRLNEQSCSSSLVTRRQPTSLHIVIVRFSCGATEQSSSGRNPPMTYV